jgi:hypothetical protein
MRMAALDRDELGFNYISIINSTLLFASLCSMSLTFPRSNERLNHGIPHESFKFVVVVVIWREPKRKAGSVHRVSSAMWKVNAFNMTVPRAPIIS